ncbi:ttc4 [Gossypium arboreum]|uniref:Ttc4 n=1 Tax=Gossypium arboreum TaxID=29729 RepID=A0A0B0NIS6_GOSAR|nr:ttc4 [Gossypium arboreum]
MALWMETGSEPKTETEIADLEAISALKESTALELKEKGNELVKKGKKHYPEAIHCYSRAINQKALNDHDTSVLFSNRAHVNLLLGNYRRALSDSQDAIKLFPANVKAYYRAAKACLSLNLLAEAKSYCESGVGKDPTNEELKKLAKQIDLKKLEQEQRAAQKVAHLYHGIRKTIIPVTRLNSTMRHRMESPYAGSGICLSKRKILRYLLEGTAAANVESIGEEEKDAADGSPYDSSAGSSKWVKVNEKRTLHDVLKEPNFIIPMIPVHYVVSKRSGFYKDFITGKWRPPA